MTSTEGQPDLSVGRAVRTAGGISGAVGLVLVAPALFGFSVVPPCPMRTLTGLDCPLCGATRATRALLTGDVAGSFDYNLLVPVMAVVAAGLGIWWFFARQSESVSFRGARTLLAGRTVWIVLAGVLAIFWVLRNLPAFNYLNSGGPSA